MLPELMKHKPVEIANKQQDLWWPRRDTATRLRVFDELEIEYIAQIGASLPWYTRLFNKIKNLF